MSQAPPQPLPAVVIPPPLPVASAAAPAFSPAAQVIPYATPYVLQTPAGPEGMWRDGRTLVTLRNVAFPCRCVKCNAPVSDYRWDKTLYWLHPAWALLLIFPGPVFGTVIYYVINLCTRASSRVNPCMCPAHRRQRRVGIWIAWLLLAAGVTDLFLGLHAGSMAMRPTEERMAFGVIVVGIILMKASLIWGAVRSRVIRPTRIDPQYARYTGAGRAFLDSLPAAVQF